MKKIWIFFLAPPAIVLFVWIFGEMVMHLWNWLLPMLFGWRIITFWQALGLLVLCRIFLGGWGGGSNGYKSRRRRGERWEQMKPEERENFRQWMRSRCGDFGASASGTKDPA